MAKHDTSYSVGFHALFPRGFENSNPCQSGALGGVDVTWFILGLAGPAGCVRPIRVNRGRLTHGRVDGPLLLVFEKFKMTLSTVFPLEKR